MIFLLFLYFFLVHFIIKFLIFFFFLPVFISWISHVRFIFICFCLLILLLSFFFFLQIYPHKFVIIVDGVISVTYLKITSSFSWLRVGVTIFLFIFLFFYVIILSTYVTCIIYPLIWSRSRFSFNFRSNSNFQRIEIHARENISIVDINLSWNVILPECINVFK